MIPMDFNYLFCGDCSSQPCIWMSSTHNEYGYGEITEGYTEAILVVIRGKQT